MTAPCNCYYGEDCTRTTVCANESVVQDLEERIAELQARVDELEAVVREAYEVWAGSEGLMQPATAPEAYVIRLIDQMATILGKALANSEGRGET